MFEQNGSLAKRLFWFVAFGALLIEVISIVIDRLNGLGYFMTVVNVVAILITLLTMFIAWHTEKYSTCYTVLCLLINLAVIPVAFLSGGGFYSGMPCFILLGLVMCAVNPHTLKRMITVTVALIGYTALCLITLKQPDLIAPISEKTQIRDMIVALFISAVAISFILSLLISDLRKINEMNMRVYGARTRMRLELLESQADNIEEAKRQRSEMRRHNMIISELAEKGDYDGLLKYLSDKQAGDERYNKKTIYCMNTTINSVLGIYARQALKKKVPMEIKTDVSQELPIPEPQLVAMISNVLESAINGAEQSGAPERIVSVDIHTKSEKLVINCRYSCVPGFSGQNEFTGHAGIGIEIVEKLVKANGGIMDFNVENGMVQCCLVINVGAEKK